MVIIPTTNDPYYDLTCNLGVCLEYSSGSAAPIRRVPHLFAHF